MINLYNLPSVDQINLDLLREVMWIYQNLILHSSVSTVPPYKILSHFFIFWSIIHILNNSPINCFSIHGYHAMLIQFFYWIILFSSFSAINSTIMELLSVPLSHSFISFLSITVVQVSTSWFFTLCFTITFSCHKI